MILFNYQQCVLILLGLMLAASTSAMRPEADKSLELDKDLHSTDLPSLELHSEFGPNDNNNRGFHKQKKPKLTAATTTTTSSALVELLVATTPAPAPTTTTTTMSTTTQKLGKFPKRPTTTKAPKLELEEQHEEVDNKYDDPDYVPPTTKSPKRFNKSPKRRPTSSQHSTTSTETPASWEETSDSEFGSTTSSSIKHKLGSSSRRPSVFRAPLRKPDNEDE